MAYAELSKLQTILRKIESSLSDESDITDGDGIIQEIQTELKNISDLNVNYLLIHDNNNAELITTLMHIAVSFHLQRVVKALLSTEAARGMRLKDNYGLTPINLACQNGDLNILQEMIANTSVSSKDLYIAAKNGHEEVVRYLCKQNVDHSYKDEDGRSAYEIGKTQEIRSFIEQAEKENSSRERIAMIVKSGIVIGASILVGYFNGIKEIISMRTIIVTSIAAYAMYHILEPVVLNVGRRVNSAFTNVLSSVMCLEQRSYNDQ